MRDLRTIAANVYPGPFPHADPVRRAASKRRRAEAVFGERPLVSPPRYWHFPLMHVVSPGHSQSALQPGTHLPLTQMSPAPSLPGLQSPLDAHAIPPPLLELPDP